MRKEIKIKKKEGWGQGMIRKEENQIRENKKRKEKGWGRKSEKGK